jgi:LysR family transcriptional regulator, glycine cleavage system transcriptional activator
MARTLPPLNWVRAFEAAARHQSFLHAAQELGVSAGAVSQQVKALETHLNVTLFERMPRGVRLSNIGKKYRDALSPALDTIADASQIVSAGNYTNPLRIAALPAIAERWLTPRLAGFQVKLSDVAVQLKAVESIMQAEKQGFDVAIHYETEIIEGKASIPLFQDNILPVCSPDFIQGAKQLELNDLDNYRLLYDIKWADDWPHWLQAAGLPNRALDREIGFSLYSMAVAAALEGQGVLMGHQSLVARELEVGRLVAPFDLAIKAPHRYVAVFEGKHATRTPVFEFLDWLLNEVRLSEANVNPNLKS